MDIKVDKTCELTFKEAISIMEQQGAVSDGEYYFGMSPIRRLDGTSPRFVIEFEGFDKDPLYVYSGWEFARHCETHKIYRCILPLSAEAAVEAMRSGKVVNMLANTAVTRLFITSCNHPYRGNVEYVFSCDGPSKDVTVYGTVEDFLDGNTLWYEVDESCNGGEE